jgi:hypothetical protein
MDYDKCIGVFRTFQATGLQFRDVISNSEFKELSSCRRWVRLAWTNAWNEAPPEFWSKPETVRAHAEFVQLVKPLDVSLGYGTVDGDLDVYTIPPAK